MAVDRILRETGTPGVEGAKNPKEEAIGLLQLAAEVEHSLMVQYLYAAASIPPGDSEPPPSLKMILSVAVQEMGHLISVQNLLLLVGGPEALHFGRDSIRVQVPDNPLPLVLEPISREALAKFVVAEMPALIEDQDLARRIPEIVEIATKAAGTPLHQVGALYAKLYWLFQKDDNPVAPLELRLNPEAGLRAGWHLDPAEFSDVALLASHEATRDEWLQSSVPNFIGRTRRSPPSRPSTVLRDGGVRRLLAVGRGFPGTRFW